MYNYVFALEMTTNRNTNIDIQSVDNITYIIKNDYTNAINTASHRNTTKSIILILLQVHSCQNDM